MEASILILFLVVVVFLLSRRRSTRRKETHQYRTTFQIDTTTKRRPFDAKTARPQSARQVLQGSAYVVDGDTLVIEKTQIRLFGVDAPEIDHPYGKKAKWALVSLCKGTTVRAEVAARDAYGRTVARCYLQDGRDLSAEMVKLGLAIDWAKFSGGTYRSLELPNVRKKLWLADARQKGRMHVWEQFEARRSERRAED
ncbi:thermonuclease family protein [Frigidibacter sp. ROC022]|uniref:thermonuclease family protein n=1 Tax=Frigidibacter sp. ROC022 TaxID=2971796 RepID=UPI00215A264D|nr:thermonuclease family protein [Frigidibacter sp. ROC022]MCR8723682.1 thermonuclease family protein [Frigidibacter sp. ROC022]